MKRSITTMACVLTLLTAIGSGPRIIAHRGYWQTDGSAQNSIRSLVKADSIGCYGSEFDVWITADNQLVVNHNRDINGKDIETGVSTELMAELLPNGERMPSLGQYLDAARDLSVELILEVKPHKDTSREDVAVPMIIDMVAAKGLTERTTYITFSRNAFDLLVAQSGRPVYFLTAIDPDELHEAGGTGADYNIKWIRTNPDWIGRFHKYGMPVNVWTVSNPADIRYCIEHDADYITTDTPENALELVAEYERPVGLTLMTYNLHAGADATVDSIGAVINSARPDFVMLQEVDAYTMRGNAKHHNGNNVISQLGSATNMFPLYGRTLNFAGGYYGIGMLSRYPCISYKVVELPNPDKHEPRILLEGLFDVNGHKVMVVCTHLSVESETTRNKQAEYIAKRYAGSTIPVIFGGDMNSIPESEAIGTITGTLTNLSGTEPTFPSDNPEKKLDYILGSKEHVRAVSNPAVIRTGGSPKSDHCPVVMPVTICF